MAHAGATVSAIFDEDLQNHLGSFGYQFVSYDRHPKTSRKGAFGSTFWNTGAAQKPTDAPRHRQCAARPVRQRARRRSSRAKRAGSARITAICEALPKLENRIDLASEKDEFGLPLGAHQSHLRSGRGRAVRTRRSTEGVEIAEGRRRQGDLAGARGIAPAAPARRHDHGHDRGQLGRQQLRPDS